MIKGFKHKGLRNYYATGSKRGINPKHATRIQVVLTILEAAKVVSDCDSPGFRLHPLKGKSKGSWSITVQANWRITFRWSNEGPSDLDYVDYH